jgi:hypothetical protein
MTDKEWTDAELIIARCASLDDLSLQIVRHAKIVLYLVCEMSRKSEQTEDGIRWLYSRWADMAVEELRSPGGPGSAH